MEQNQSQALLCQWKEQREAILSWLTAHGYHIPTQKTQQKSFFTPRTRDMKDLKMAAIMDQFTLESYAPECHLLELTPAHWREEVDAFEPDLLFIESAWQGKDGLWYHKVDRYSQELYELTQYLRKKGVPIVFWNKEDPVYTDIFMLAAGYADVVFTTDIDCIPRYKAELGHDRVYHLHFAAQPRLHNPIEKYDRKDKFCFAGAYYHKYKERCQVFDDFAQQFIAGKGLDIYDRNYGHARPEHAFPAQYEPYILGSLPSSQIDVAYKGYTYGINMNSIQQSQTMFARRAFEMMASNTITVGNFSRGTKNYFGDLTICTNDAKTVELYLERCCQDPATRDKYRLLGLRKALSEGLYQDRLGYITEKVFGVNMKPALPAVTVLARAGSKKQAERLARLFQAQTLPGARLVFVGTGLQGKEGYSCIAAGALASTRCGDVCGEGLVAVWEGTDWYGPNYLLDLVLTWNYGAFRGAGKAAHFTAESDSPLQGELAYRPAQSLVLRRSMVRWDVAQDMTLAELSGNTEVTGPELMGTDPFQYCQDWTGETCPKAEDLKVADQGLPLSKIQSCAEAIPIPEPREDLLRITGQQLAQSKPSAKIPVTYKSNGTDLVIQSELPENKHEYIYNQDVSIEVSPWLVEGKLPVQFRGMGSLDLICVLICYNKDGKKLSPLYPRLNRRELLALPEGTETVKIGFRPKGPGSATVKDVLVGGAEEVSDRVSFLSRSNVLVLTNHYPSGEALYRNMFVHKRVTGYREEGLLCDVLRMYPYSKDGYREFEGVNVLEGKGGDLMGILDSGAIDTVCVHFLDREMWEVLKHYLSRIRLIIWSHGADIHPWWRRKFNYESEQQLEQAKAQSEARMTLWREVFAAAKEHKSIHFVYVSQCFANEVMEDYQVQLTPEQYSVIHNLIDTDLFTYEKKDPEQRKKIVTIKPFAGKKYANDLTTKGLLELSKRPYFGDLEIDIYGHGDDFDTDNGPLKKFENIHLHDTFLRQDEIAQIHKAHGVFIATTRWDSQGVSRDEAMSSGLVVIAHNCTAIPEFVDETCGILIPEESYVELADAIERLYSDRALFQRLSENAAQRVRSQTSKEFTIDKEIALIQGHHTGARA